MNRPAYFANCLPSIQGCMPKEWVTPQALEKMMGSLRMSARHKEEAKKRAKEKKEMKQEEKRLKEQKRKANEEELHWQ